VGGRGPRGQCGGVEAGPADLTERLGGALASFAEGERVVVDGQYKLRQKSKVTVTSPEAPAVAKQAQAS